MTIEFSALHLIVEGKSPSLDILKSAFSQEDEIFTFESIHYLISTSIIDDQYFWFYAQYGKSLPYSKTVYNTESNTIENNPRTTAQVETAKQLFGLYDSKNKIFYYSNIKKKSVFEKRLNSLINQEVIIKAFFKNVDEFCEQIKKIKSIKFIAKRNLFNANGEILKIFPSPKDLFGLGMPEDFTLEAIFSNASVTGEFISALKRMATWRKNQEADSLVCIGFDDKNIETIFNIDTFIQKSTISTSKCEQGRYDPNSVCSALINDIQSKADEKIS